MSVRITEAIGFDAEVSEPNGPAVHGYFTARWADERQKDFDRWLAEHERSLREAIAKEIEAAVSGSERGQHRLYLGGMLIAADVARGKWPT